MNGELNSFRMNVIAFATCLASSTAMLVATGTTSYAASEGDKSTETQQTQIQRRADSCGSGYHKQSNGKLSGSTSKSLDGRKATAKIQGYVRFCTRNRKFKPDQRNQRVLIGVPESVISTGTFIGPRVKNVCAYQKIVVRFKRQPEFGVSWSGVSPGVNATFKNGVVTHQQRVCDVPTQRALRMHQSTFVVTAGNGPCWLTAGGGPAAACFLGPVIDRVDITTSAVLHYRKGRTTEVLKAIHQEIDFSGQS